jgi:TATA-binding protein-associated factor
LFDFLMPGFLGSHAQFVALYARPIAQSQHAAKDSPEGRAGEEALRSLHRQVLPFILRREKAAVAQELPPKIVQDRFCDASPLQRQLLEAMKRSVDDASLSEGARGGSGGDALRALQYMRKLCTHPGLVLPNRSDLDTLEHGPKFVCLLALLDECGVTSGLDDEGELDEMVLESDVENGNSPGGGVLLPPHRVLVFAQLRATLDLAESLLRTRRPSLRFLRLDGSTPAGNRVPLCDEFNQDAGIGVMLLTTAVGGLGLNLASADTVIFLEHDWNPQKDVQAMDRAHRLTSKRTVNVFRLILRDTIEERILGLQAFKLKLATTVVSEDNRELATMDTNTVLEMFDRVAEREAPARVESAVVDADEGQYERDFNLGHFVSAVSHK